MTFLLLTLLAIALTVTIAGFLLSGKMHSDDAQMAYYGGRKGYRGYQGSRDYRRDIPLRRRRRIVEAEQPSGLNFSFLVGLGRIFGRGVDEPIPWKLILVGLVSIFILGLYSLTLLLPRNAVWDVVTFGNSALANAVQQNAPQPQYSVSQKLVRIGQLDPSQYDSTDQYNLWAQSTCSTASMTVVFNAYGRHYRIADVLKVESALGEITPQDGLLHDVGIQRTAAQFGFKTSWGYNLSLDQIITIANNGRPVIVDFPPYKYAGGHLLVVRGGNANYVFTADSSIFNRTSLTRQQFMQWWGGFSAIVTPAN